jgi:FkbM family methyltransferase
MKEIIKNFLKKFDLRLIKISKNQNSFDLINKQIVEKNIDLILDVGANTGQFVEKLRKTGYQKNIISFEPLKKEHEIIKKKSMNDKFWTVYDQCALGDIDGKIILNISNYSPASSILSFTDMHKEAKPSAVMIDKEIVNIFKLDTVSKNFLQKNIMIKIDTQGYENKILRGAVNLLKHCRIIFCEVSFQQLYDGQELWQETVSLLETQGFVIYSMENGVFNKSHNALLQGDMIFLKND